VFSVPVASACPRVRVTLMIDYKMHFPIRASLYWEDATVGSLLKLDEGFMGIKKDYPLFD